MTDRLKILRRGNCNVYQLNFPNVNNAIIWNGKDWNRERQEERASEEEEGETGHMTVT